MKSSFRGVVGDVSTGSLLAKPFANVTLRCAGGLGELGGGLRSTFREGFIEAQLVSDANQCGVKSGAKIYDSFAQKFMEFVLIDAHRTLLGGCRCGNRFSRILGGSCATGKQKFSAAAVGTRVVAVQSFDIELRGGQEAHFFRVRSLCLHVTFVGAVAAPFTNSEPQLSRQTFYPNCERESMWFLHVIVSCSFDLYGMHGHPSIAGESGSAAVAVYEAPEKFSGQRVAT